MVNSLEDTHFAMGSRKTCIDLSIQAWIMLSTITCFTATVHSMGQCAENELCYVQRISYLPGHEKDGDRFTTGRTSGTCNSCSVQQSNESNNSSDDRCWCQCSYQYTFWPDINKCSKERQMLGCRVRVGNSELSKATTVDNLRTGVLKYMNNDLNQNWDCIITKQEYLENDGQWRNLMCATEHNFSMTSVGSDNRTALQWSGSDDDNKALHGLLVKLSISCSHGEIRESSCLLFKLVGTHTYDPTNPECEDEDTTSQESKFSTAPSTTVFESGDQYTTSTLLTSSQPLSVADATSLTTLWTSQSKTDGNIVPRTDILYNSSLATLKPGSPDSLGRYPTAAIAGGTSAAVIIFIVAGVVLFIVWRRKFKPRNVGKHKSQRVTMSSLQNGHPHPTEGTVDNEIYAGDDAGIVDNVIYEGGVGADGVFSNPGYADKTPQFKPRMDAPGAFVQPNPGATDKTPQPQRNIIIDEPQYAQIVDDQYADPQKVRDRKDKKNKKKAAKEENYSDLKGPHERQPGANNSNSNHIYQGLNKGADYQSLRGPREHHEVRPSQVPKTPQDGQDYTSLTPGSSKPSAGTLSKEADYTVLEGPDSPGEETAAGPDYTTLDGPDSPGDESASGPDYTVLDGPDSPGD